MDGTVTYIEVDKDEYDNLRQENQRLKKHLARWIDRCNVLRGLLEQVANWYEADEQDFHDEVWTRVEKELGRELSDG